MFSNCVYVGTYEHMQMYTWAKKTRTHQSHHWGKLGQSLVIHTEIGKLDLTQLIVCVWQESCPSNPLYKWKLLLIPSDL